MSEAKRVPTWGEIHDAERAAVALCNASAEIGRITSIIPTEDGGMLTHLDDAALANDRTTRALRAWIANARVARESEDLERKKAGLL